MDDPIAMMLLVSTGLVMIIIANILLYLLDVASKDRKQ